MRNTNDRSYFKYIAINESSLLNDFIEEKIEVGMGRYLFFSLDGERDLRNAQTTSLSIYRELSKEISEIIVTKCKQV